MMEFKKFERWTYEHACSGEWRYDIALFCMQTCRKIKKLPFWKRKKMWENINAAYNIKEIIEYVDNLTPKRTFVMK